MVRLIPGVAAEPACLDGIPLELPGLAPQSVCPLDPRQSPEYWRSKFCEDPEGFCEEQDLHPLPLPPCTRAPHEILRDYQASGLAANDVAGLFPADALAKVASLLPEAKQALLEVVGSPKWQAPESVRTLIAGAHLVDPNDLNTPAEEIEAMNLMCQTRLDYKKYPRKEPIENDASSAETLARKQRLEGLRKELLAAAEDDTLPDHLGIGIQAAVTDDGAIYVCPATLRLAKEGPPEAFLSILLHELGHLSGSCNVGRDLVQNASLPELGGCEVDPVFIDALPDGRNRLDYLRRLHQRMRCFEEAGISRRGTSARSVGRLMQELSRRTGEDYDCLFSKEQLTENRNSQKITGLMQTCHLTNVKMLVMLQNQLLGMSGEIRESAMRAAIRKLKIIKTMKLPNENQFAEAHADALAAESIASTLERLRKAGKIPAAPERSTELTGLLHAPATLCDLKVKGLLRKRQDHGPEENRARTFQFTPQIRRAMGCSLGTRGADRARIFDSCVMRDPISPLDPPRSK